MSTQPCWRSRIAGSASWVRCSGASTCISSMRRARFSGNSSSGRRNVTAALFTRMSGAPTCSITSRHQPLALLASATGRPAPRPRSRPRRWMPSSVSRNDPTYLGSGSIVLAVSATVAPSAANRSATALPSPRLAARHECDLPCTSARHESRYYARCPHGRSTSTTCATSARAARRRRCRRRSPAAHRASPTPHAPGTGASWSRSRRPGVPPVLNRDVLRQARLLRALQGTAVPVPEVLWEDAGDPPDEPPLFVMSFVEGTSLEPLFDRHGDDPEAVVAERMRDAARTLAVAARARPGFHRPRRRAGRRSEHRGRSLVPAARDRRPGARCPAGPKRRRRSPSARTGGDARRGRARRLPARQPPGRRRRPSPRSSTGRSGRVGDPRIDLGWFLANADPATYQRADALRGCRCRHRPSCSTSTRALGSRPRRHRPGSRHWRASSRRRRGR